MLTDTRESRYAKLKSLPMESVRWTAGFWAEKFRVCSDTMVPNMWRLLDDASISHNLTNFRIAVGEEEGRHEGPPFGDGDLYKWLEAASFVYGKTKEESLGRSIDETIDLIRQAQREDGYIFTKQEIENRANPGGSEPLGDDLNFEVYNLGHLMTAACVHFRATGKRALLDLAEKAAGYLETTFSELAPEKAKTAVCPSHYMGVLELYRATSNKDYLELAERLIALRDLVPNGTDDNQDRIPLAEQRKAVGHAVRANYLYAGVADLYAETGKSEFLPVLESCWDNVVHEKMYVTGSCGALYDGVSPYGSWDHDEIQRTHQAYGREYELPNITAYNETCAAIGNVLWNWRMLNLTAESRFADVIELVLYNGALSGISLDGTKFFYSNALRRHKELPFDLKWSRQREPYLSSFCCPPNLVRTIAESSAYAYAVSADSLYVLLYGGNRISCELDNGTRLGLLQETEYPWEGIIRFRLEELSGTKRFSLKLRLPAWAGEAEVGINGVILEEVPTTDGFLSCDREWSAGDEVELRLPMRPRMLEAHPLLEETRNHTAVQRGPIVYCLEQADLPDGASVSEIYVPEETEWREESLTIGSERMVALTAKLLRREETAWEKELYRPATALTYQVIRTRLIPYYAWDNRGFGEMTVWMPLYRGGRES